MWNFLGGGGGCVTQKKWMLIICLFIYTATGLETVANQIRHDNSKKRIQIDNKEFLKIIA